MHELDSDSVGDVSRFLSFTELERGLSSLEPAPTDSGRLSLIVRSSAARGRRETPTSVLLSPEEGLPGDTWGRQPDRRVEAQLAVMQTGVARLIANGQPLPLFGDNLWLDLDLSRENLPAGSRLRIGECLLEVTPLAHNGCRKFHNRFGADALRFVNDTPFRHRNLRGIYLRAIERGEVRVNDDILVVSRGTFTP